MWSKRPTLSRLRGNALAPLITCSAVLLHAPLTLAQHREPQDGGAIIIRQEGGITVRFGTNVQPRQNTIPPDEELLAIDLDERLLKHIAQLDDDDYDVREAAMHALISEPGGHLPFFAILARRSEFALSAEQHHRLMAALRERIMNTPGGAIGISMSRQPIVRNDRIEIEVTDLLPGLPAIEVMRVGDRIAAIDGVPFQSSNDLTTRVQLRRPGDVVTLLVVRAKRDEHGRPVLNEQEGMVMEQLEIPIALGSTELLRDPETGRPQISPFIAEHRRQEVREAEQRFRREPLRITLDGELPGFAASSNRAGGGERDDAVENHPSIVILKQYLERVRAGTIPLDPALVHEQLSVLRFEQRRPGLSDDDREHLERVIERFMEIMREF